MVHVINEQTQARWQAMPEHAFPDFREGKMAPDVVMAELPRSGSGLWVLCCGCWVERWIGGEEICRRWPQCLMVPQIAWAKALRCQECGSSRFSLHRAGDPGAVGFQHDTWDTSQTVAARRLSAWLVGTGVDLEDIAGRLRDVPTPGQRAALGL